MSDAPTPPPILMPVPDGAMIKRHVTVVEWIDGREPNQHGHRLNLVRRLLPGPSAARTPPPTGGGASSC